jgi:RHS repeat-associated protein
MSSSTATGAAQSLVYNYLLHLPALSIVRTGSTDLRYYIYFPNGTLLYSIEAADNTRHFYHFDEMGNTVLLSGDSGAMTDSYAVTPYGESADHFGTTDNPFTWQGQYGVMQEGAGLYYVRRRHYDASATRFLSRDPLPSYDPRSAEPYAYASGNPLRFIDPFGKDVVSDWFAEADTTVLPGLSPLPSDEAADYAGDFYDRLIALADSFSDDDDFFYYYDLANIVNSNLGLDWQGWEMQVPVVGIASPLEIYQVPSTPSSTWTIGSVPAPVQTAGPVQLAPITCVCVGGCGGAAASTTGVASGSLLTQDGGSLLTQDGGSLLTQDGGSLIAQDGGSLIGTGGSTLIGSGGSTLIGSGGSTLIGSGGSTFKRKK